MTSGSRMQQPYGGQKVCPVTGAKLASMGEPVAVETGVGARKPSFLGKLFGKKPSPGVVVYVCCPECAAKVKAQPWTYATKAIEEVNGWSQESRPGIVSDRTARR